MTADNALLPSWNYDWYSLTSKEQEEGYLPDYVAFAATQGTEYDFRVMFSQHLTEKQKFAIAHRIAAAQELLTACQTALADIKQTVNFDEGDSQTLNTVAELEAAIAKATEEYEPEAE